MAQDLVPQFHERLRNGFLASALFTAERIIRTAASDELARYWEDIRDRLQRRIQRDARFPRDSTSLERKLGIPRDKSQSENMKGNKRSKSGHRKSLPSEPLVEVLNAKPGICRCPTRIIGRKKPYNHLPDLLKANVQSYVTRFQNLSAPNRLGSGDVSIGLQYPLSYFADAAAGETALPFYIFNVGLLPQSQMEVVVGGVKSVQLVRPKVCYRLYYRDAYNYDATLPVQSQYFFKAFDGNILRNAPDTVTNATTNDYKVEWTSTSMANYPRAKNSICNWVEVQTLLRQGSAPAVDNTNVHTGFIQFPEPMCPSQVCYKADYATAYTYANNTKSYDEAISMDSFWTRFFNKRTAHPLMRSGGNFEQIKPRMFFEDTHCLKNELTNDASHPASTQTCTRWNLNRKFSTTEMSDALAAFPAEVNKGYETANYASIEGNDAFGTYPEWGKQLFAFVYCTQYGSPPVVPPAEGSNSSFDIMIRQFVQTSTRVG